MVDMMGNPQHFGKPTVKPQSKTSSGSGIAKAVKSSNAVISSEAKAPENPLQFASFSKAGFKTSKVWDTIDEIYRDDKIGRQLGDLTQAKTTEEVHKSTTGKVNAEKASFAQTWGSAGALLADKFGPSVKQVSNAVLKASNSPQAVQDKKEIAAMSASVQAIQTAKIGRVGSQESHDATIGALAAIGKGQTPSITALSNLESEMQAKNPKFQMPPALTQAAHDAISPDPTKAYTPADTQTTLAHIRLTPELSQHGVSRNPIQDMMRQIGTLDTDRVEKDAHGAFEAALTKSGNVDKIKYEPEKNLIDGSREQSVMDAADGLRTIAERVPEVNHSLDDVLADKVSDGIVEQMQDVQEYLNETALEDFRENDVLDAQGDDDDLSQDV